ncbi:MAG: DNA-binding protein [Mesorhizobium sp.]|nr:MAG: DNA-binding protein [Mesorhizobium sp.]
MAADILTISTKTMANWRVRGFGPKFVKLGSRVAYPVPEFVKFIDSRTCASTSQKLRD